MTARTTTTPWRDVRTLSLSSLSSLLSLLAMLTLLAVFMMHGPSSDHSMLMPGGSNHHAGMSVGQHTATEATAGRMNTAADLIEAQSVQPAATPRATSVKDHRMAHADCVATLRADTDHAVHADVAVTTHVAHGGPDLRIVPAARADRAPPRPPDLEELCISRT